MEFGIPAIMLGFVLLRFSYRDIIFGCRSRFWPTTKAIVKDVADASFVVDVVSRYHGGPYPQKQRRTVYTFEYFVDNVKYKTNRIYYGFSLFQHERIFKLKRSVTVAYHPDHPKEAVVMPGLQCGSFLGMFFIVLGFYMCRIYS